MDWLRTELNAAGGFLDHIFTYIFPEYPPIGIVIAILSLVSFLYYAFKGGLVPALKIGLSGFVGATIALFIVHLLGLLFHVNYRL